jgi:hypothetical protein
MRIHSLEISKNQVLEEVSRAFNIAVNSMSIVVTVRKVISGSPDWETDPIRALIEGACRVWQWAPSRAAPQ